MCRCVSYINDTFTKMYDRETYGETDSMERNSLSCRQLDPH